MDHAHTRDEMRFGAPGERDDPDLSSKRNFSKIEDRDKKKNKTRFFFIPTHFSCR